MSADPARPADKTEVAALRDAADGLRRTVREQLGVTLAPDAAGVVWLDGFLTRQHERLPGEAGDGENVAADPGLAAAAGAFLGEALLAAHGGRWVWHGAGGWGVELPGPNGDGGGGFTAFPLTKARKHLEDGSGDSVRSFFSLAPVIASGAFGKADD